MKGLGNDALLSRHGGVVECRWNLSGTRKVYSRDPKRFRMMDCKTMTTPMASNLKLLSDVSLETVDTMM